MRSFVLKYMIVFSITSTLALLLLKIFQCTLYGVDDANIFFVYAKNLAGGNGLVYNIGGERVEGFTSLLWVMLCSVAFKIFTNPELALLLVNIAILSFGTTLTVSILPLLVSPDSPNRLKPYWQVGFMIILYSMPAFVAWNTITLMDNALWSTLLLIAGVVTVISQNFVIKRVNGIFSLLIILLILTRPESFVWIAVFTGILFILRKQQRGAGFAIRSLVSPLLTLVLSVSAITIFRLVYFGYPLPNTFYAKVSPSIVYNMLAGARYFLLYFLSNPFIQVCVIAVFFTMLDTIARLFFNKQGKIAGPEMIAVIALTGLLIPVLVGGDHFGSYRFYQNIYPILILNLFYFLRFVLPGYVHFAGVSNVYRWVLYGVIASVFLAVNINEWRLFKTSSKIAHEFTISEEGRERGRFIASLFSKLQKLPGVGEVVAGGVKYEYPGEIVDLMGLNNTAMAHNRGLRKGVKNHAAFEKATFLILKPDIVAPLVIMQEKWVYNQDTVQNSFANHALKEIFDDREFQDLYVYGKIQNNAVSMKKALIGWFRQDFLLYLDNKVMLVTTYAYPTGKDLSE